MQGKFIVFEGIDGSGAETQSKLLFERLKKASHKVRLVSYPDYSGPIGKLINDYLHQKHEMSNEALFMLFTADFVKDAKGLKEFISNGGTVIANRYFTSTLAYQSAGGMAATSMLRVAEALGLPKPDMAVYLKISPETSAKRKMEEHNCLDRNEADRALLVKVAAAYEKLAAGNVFCKWAMLDGEKPIAGLSAEIANILGS